VRDPSPGATLLERNLAALTSLSSATGARVAALAPGDGISVAISTSGHPILVADGRSFDSRRHPVSAAQQAAAGVSGSPVAVLGLGSGYLAEALLERGVEIGAIVERASATTAFTLVGPGLPVWSLGFRPGGGELLTGGSDRVVRRWDMKRGEPIGPVAMARPDDFLAGFTGDRGAELFQACAACHTLTPDGGNRAGPTLHGVFGRRIATAPGYNFSTPLKALDIVWNAETIQKLFEIGRGRAGRLWARAPRSLGAP